MGGESKFNDKLIIGNDVVVTGKRSLYNQLVQISNVTSVEVLNTNVQLPAIKTYETLDPQELLNVQGQRVSIPNLTIASIPAIGTGSYSVVVSSGSTTVEIRIDRYVEDFAEINEFFQGMVVGQGIDVEGVFAGRFNQTVQLMVTDVNQLKAKPITKELFTSLLENKLNPGQNIVDNLNLQTSIVIAGTTYQVTWQSSNPEVINPDGTVVRPEIGEDDVNVVLTVKTTFNDEEITITFEVTVLAKRDSSQVITYVETFDNFTSTSKNYVNGVFVGVNGIEWEYNALRGDLDDYSIKGKGVMFGNQTEHKDGVSFLKATISGGIGDFKVDTLKAFTSGTERKLGLYINGELKGEFTLDNSVTTVQVFEVKGINVSGTFTLELRMLTPGEERAQITIDNLTWTTFDEPKELTDEEYLDIAGQYVTSELAWLNDAEVSNSLDLPQHHPNYKDLRFEWESSNPSVISNDGVYTQPEEDTEVTLILKVFIPSNNTDVANLTYEFTVTIKGLPQPGQPVTVTAQYTGSTTKMQGGGINNAELINLDPHVFTVTSFSSSGQNQIGLNKDGTIRLYGKTNKNILTIKINSGVITNVIIKFAGTVNTALIKADDVELHNAIPDSNSLLTFADLNAIEFSIQNADPDENNDQLHINYIEITFIPE